MSYQSHHETGGGEDKNKMSLFNGVKKCKGLNFRAEKEELNEKLKEGDWQEEVDDSGFYAGELTCAVQQVACLLFPHHPCVQVDPSLRWA